MFTPLPHYKTEYLSTWLDNGMLGGGVLGMLGVFGVLCVTIVFEMTSALNSRMSLVNVTVTIKKERYWGT